ncbi:MAG: NYN domain-containing protein [Candidatus Binatia bacterium]
MVEWPPMRWLVDGYNVIRCAPELTAHEHESLQAGREALCRLLASAARTSGDQFTVVFDGARGGTAFGGRGVRVLFSRAPEKADQVLARLASAGVAVVSNDREVHRAVARTGAVVVTADEFVARVFAPSGFDEEEEDEPRPRPKKGNPRRPPKKARAAGRALRRLDPSRKR